MTATEHTGWMMELIGEVRQLRTEVLEWKLACAQRDEDMDKDVLTMVRERDKARAKVDRLINFIREFHGDAGVELVKAQAQIDRLSRDDRS